MDPTVRSLAPTATALLALVALGSLLAMGATAAPPASDAAHQAQPVQAHPEVVRRVFPRIPVQPLDLQTRAAANVVHGRVLAAEAIQPESGWPYTRYTVEVFAGLKRATGTTLELRVAGGPGLEVVGAPRLDLGQEAVLFLNEGPGAMGLLGLGHGLYSVVPGADGGAEVRGTHAGPGTSLGSFLQRVEQALYAGDAGDAGEVR